MTGGRFWEKKITHALVSWQVLIIFSADCESDESNFLPAVHICGQTAVMLTCLLQLRLSTSHRALPLISSSCAHSPQAGAFLSVERGRAEPLLTARRPVTSVQETRAANASYGVSRHHTHKGIAATASNVTKLRLTIFQRGCVFFIIVSAVMTWLFSYLLWAPHWIHAI